MENDKQIVIYDGVCVFCNRAVNFIIKRDPKELFVFTPMQSEFAKSLMQKNSNIDIDIDTITLIKEGKSFLFSDAALEIAKELSGFWKHCYAFRFIPKPVRDFLYKLFARNRYSLFGKSDQCAIPDEKTRARYIGL